MMCCVSRRPRLLLPFHQSVCSVAIHSRHVKTSMSTVCSSGIFPFGIYPEPVWPIKESQGWPISWRAALLAHPALAVQQKRI